LKDKVMQILNENGLMYEDDKLLSNIDSLQYMSVLVSLEEELDFELPDEYLGQDILSSFIRLCEIVDESYSLSH